MSRASVLFLLGATGGPLDKDVPDSYRKMKNPLKPTTTLLAETRNLLYDLHCEYCHGSTGKGDGPKMVVKKGQTPPNFTTEQFAKRSDQWIMWRMSEGVVDTRMSGYKELLSERDRWALVLLIRSFNPKSTHKPKK